MVGKVNRQIQMRLNQPRESGHGTKLSPFAVIATACKNCIIKVCFSNSISTIGEMVKQSCSAEGCARMVSAHLGSICMDASEGVQIVLAFSSV